MSEHQSVRGVLFDLPATIDRAREYLGSRGLLERIELVGGDMFNAVPRGGELYVISKVLNDWSDERVVKILKNTAAAMTTKSRLIVVEDINSDDDVDLHSTLRDLFFLACSGGEIRGIPELRRLIVDAGLKISRVVPVPGVFSIVECSLD
ncbi:MAG: methyltransferase [Polyangiaceae bacterium]